MTVFRVSVADMMGHSLERLPPRTGEYMPSRGVSKQRTFDEAEIERGMRAYDHIGWDWYDRNVFTENESTQRARKAFREYSEEKLRDAIAAITKYELP